MTSFGLVYEGLTDKVVIKNILTGYFNAQKFRLRPLQPELDETDSNRVVGDTGWHPIIEYVGSNAFYESFQFLDFVIVQIDTDVCEQKHYDVPRYEDGVELEPLQLLERVRDRFRVWMGGDFYEAYRKRIIFAIAVDSIECWLLPLYYPNDKSKRAKWKNCLDTLNPALNSEYGFTISAKEECYYQKASKPYAKRKALLQAAAHNPSLKAFFDELDSRKLLAESEA